jgi:hypothetical protein
LIHRDKRFFERARLCSTTAARHHADSTRRRWLEQYTQPVSPGLLPAGRSPERAPSNHPHFNEPNAWNQSSGARLRDFNHTSILSRLKRQSLPILNAGSSPRPANLQMVERLTLRKFATSPVVSRSDVGSAVPARGSRDGTARWSRVASLPSPVSSSRFSRDLKVADFTEWPKVSKKTPVWNWVPIRLGRRYVVSLLLQIRRLAIRATPTRVIFDLEISVTG